MADVTLTVNYEGLDENGDFGALVSTVTFPEAMIGVAAKNMGYQALVSDPTIEAQIQAKAIAWQALNADDPQRNTIAAEIQALEQARNTPVANPIKEQQFCVKAIMDDIKARLLDQTEAQRKAQEAADAEVARQKALADSAIAVNTTKAGA